MKLTPRSSGFESESHTGLGIIDSRLQTSHDKGWEWYVRQTSSKSVEQLYQTIQYTGISFNTKLKVKNDSSHKLRS